MYDGDEVYHAQLVYLLGHGYKPFVSFYQIYSPIYHVLLLPVFTAVGYSFRALAWTRVLMVILFLVRLAVAYIVVRKIFDVRVGILFIFFLLLNPFSVFSEMQIRPDNLMILVYTMGILLLIFAHKKAVPWIFMVSGAIVSLAFLINAKIFPSVTLLLFVYGYWCWTRKNWREFRYLLYGYVLSFVIFASYFLVTNSFVEMVKQMIIEPHMFLKTTVYPTRVGFFYLPDNIYIYGVAGEPLTWMYVWILPLLAFGGLYHMFATTLQNKAQDSLTVIRIFLGLSLPVQWLLLFSLNTAFI